MPTKELKSLTLAQLAVLEQLPPKPNDIRPSFAMAMDWLQGRAPELQDAIAERAELGFNRYGMYLQPNNGRCAIIDCIQEALDKMNYYAQEWVEAVQVNSPFADDIIEDFWDEVEKIFRLCKRLEWKRQNGTSD
jgi:hypothetical protein